MAQFFIAKVVFESLGVFCEDVDLDVTSESCGMVEPSCDSKSGFRLVCIGFFSGPSVTWSIFATTKPTIRVAPLMMIFCALPATPILLFPFVGVLHGIIVHGPFYDVCTLVEISNLLLVAIGPVCSSELMLVVQARSKSWW